MERLAASRFSCFEFARQAYFPATPAGCRQLTVSLVLSHGWCFQRDMAAFKDFGVILCSRNNSGLYPEKYAMIMIGKKRWALESLFCC